MQTDDIIKWLLENVDSSLVPNDEGNDDALLYNFLMAAEKLPDRWNYEPHQVEYLSSIRKKYNIQVKP